MKANEEAIEELERSESERQKRFCQAYLQTMDVSQAARLTGETDGFGMLGTKAVRKRLAKMREAVSGEISREDVIRRMAQLAFGGAGDALKVARTPDGAEDLFAVAELKVTDKGGVEIKLVDRIRALEALYDLLGQGGDGAEALYQALEEAADDGEKWQGD